MLITLFSVVFGSKLCHSLADLATPLEYVSAKTIINFYALK